MTRLPALQREPSSRGGRRFLVRSFLFGLGNVLIKVPDLVLLPLYVAVLPAHEYGILGIAGSLTVILRPTLSLGIQSAAVRFYFTSRDDDDARRLFGNLWFFSIFGAGLVYLLIDALGQTISGILFSSIPYSPAIRLAVWTAFVGSAFLDLPAQLFRARGQAGWFAFSSIGVLVATLTGAFVFVVHLHEGAYGALLASFVASCVVAVPLSVFMLTYARFSLDGRLIAAALRYSVPMVPQLVSHWILNFSDRIVLERFVSMAEVGIYSAGYTLGWSLSFVRMGLAQAMIPLYGSSDPTNPNHVASLARATTLYMSAMCVGAMLLGVLGVDVVAWLSPESYASAGEVMRVVSVAALFFGLYNPAVQVINITLGRTVAVALITMSGAALNLALNLVVVPRVGMIGAAFTTAVSYLAVALVTLRTATAMGRVPYDTPRLAGLIVTAVLAVATAWAVMPTTMGGRILADAVILVSAFAILLRTRLIDLAELRRLAAGSGAVRPGEGS